MVRPATATDPTWIRCGGCAALLYRKRLNRNLGVCHECGHHGRLSATERLAQLLDPGSLTRYDADLAAVDVLGFTDTKPYPQRLAAARERTGQNDAVVAGTGRVDGMPVVVAVVDFDFLGGSIGAVVGEVVARAARRALDRRTPLLLITASGGARMQEGALSLMQLAKTSQELGRLHEAGILCLNLNTDPTYGGATASFAVLGDVVLAEPGARIGFAGPQVIRQTIRQDLPAGFQTAEFGRDTGHVDLIVAREALRHTLARLLRLHAPRRGGWDRRAHHGTRPAALVTDPTQLCARPAAETVRLARALGRPTTLDFCGYLLDEFVEFAGDRLLGDDPALVGGVGRLDGRTVVMIGHQKGHDPAELVRRNFGMPQPWGYHKAHRLMTHAATFGLPVVALIDTPGAYPGLEAEQRGQGQAIARCIMHMSRLPVPTVAVVTGEGGSGGALAIGVGNRVLMLENSYFSVISPEGCSTILWGTSTHAAQAAEQLGITAPDLLALGVMDGVVTEPPGGSQADPPAAAARLRDALVWHLDDMAGESSDALIDQRYERFARLGTFTGGHDDH
jgi:acetyl-CoA carboxylase carboxyl transferase subunit beta